MTNKEFALELEKNYGASQGIMSIYNIFVSYQELVFSALIEFDRVCRKNGIRYVLAYGSLLGAIRDSGQIPWDYDVDVFVPYEDRKKLITALDEDLCPSYYYCSVENDSHCSHLGLTRIAPIGYDTKFLHVDVFYLAHQSNDLNKDNLKRNIRELCALYRGKITSFKELNRFSKREIISVLKYKFLSMFINVVNIRLRYQTLLDNVTTKESKLFEADRFALDYSFSPHLFEKPIDFPIGEHRFFVPMCYKKLLTELYGDYSKIPALEKRYNEMIRHYSLLTKNCPNVQPNNVDYKMLSS